MSTCLLAALLALTACLGAAQSQAPDEPSVIFKRQRTWGDYAQPLAALRLAQPPTAMRFLPEGRRGALPALLAVGDAAGGLLLLTPGGRVVARHATGTASPVTALGSYLLGRNATVLLTGHAGGELRLHLLQHPPTAAGPRNGWEGWEEEEEEDPSGSSAGLELSLLDALPPEALLCGAGSCGAGQASGTCGAGGDGAPGGCPPIAALWTSGRAGAVAAVVVASDASGGLAVIKHGGPAGGGARVVRRAALAQQPLALRIATSGAAATVLGSTGLAYQRLTVPHAPKGGSPADKQQQQAEAQEAAASAGAAPAPTDFKPCRGLNGSTLLAVAFDAQHSTRAYGITAEGSVLALVVGGDQGVPAGCAVRAAAALPADLLPADPAAGSGGVALATLPGYLLLSAGGSLAIFNVTASPRCAPRLLLRQPLVPLQAQLTGGHAAEAQAGTAQQQQAAPALLAAGQGGHVALLLGGSAVAVYETALPHRPPPQPYKASLAWMQLLQPAAMVFVAAVVLQRARAKRGEGGGAALVHDPRLREFERLLQDPMAGAAASRRHRPAPGGWRAGGGGGSDDDGSDMDDSTGLLGGLGRSAGRAAPSEPSGGKRRGLFGRVAAAASSGGGGGSGRQRDAARQRAAVLAATDDADIAALRAELAGAELAGGSVALGPHDGFGSDMDMGEDEAAALHPSCDELSQLRQRLGRTHLA